MPVNIIYPITGYVVEAPLQHQQYSTQLGTEQLQPTSLQQEKHLLKTRLFLGVYNNFTLSFSLILDGEEIIVNILNTKYSYKACCTHSIYYE